MIVNRIIIEHIFTECKAQLFLFNENKLYGAFENGNRSSKCVYYIP